MAKRLDMVKLAQAHDPKGWERQPPGTYRTAKLIASNTEGKRIERDVSVYKPKRPPLLSRHERRQLAEDQR